ncbi:MAG: ArsR family transcriptional regulator [Ponticaulis sp.]|nr:ArsR family transcriptional regulator [Ponticaulis sp.]
MDKLIEALRSIGEPTRLRVLALLSHGELAVGELVQILQLSQPRLSRHMKFLTAAGLVERLPEGAWVFYRLPADGPGRELTNAILEFLPDDHPELARDLVNLEGVRKLRQGAAEEYFNSRAEDWDDVRGEHYPAQMVERALLDAAGDRSYDYLVDFGTGTGRMITLFGDRVKRAEGIDLSHKMLTIARSNLEQAQMPQASVRFGDVTAPPFADGTADLITIHQVLHYMDQPERIISEAARILKPDGRLLIVDFAPHQLEFLRTEHEHRHLGLNDHAVEGWMRSAKLSPQPPCHLTSETDSNLTVTIWIADKLPLIGEKAA